MTAPARATLTVPVGPPRPAGPRSPARRRVQLGAPPKAFDQSAYADEATLALGGLAHLFHVSPLSVLIAGVFAIGGIWAWSWDRFRHRGVTLFAIGVTAASTAWIWWAAKYTPWSVGSILALLAGTFALGPVYAMLRWKTDKRNEKAELERAEANAVAKQHQMVAILTDAGAPDITVDASMDGEKDGVSWVKGERQFPAGFSLALALGAKAPDTQRLMSLLPEIEKLASGKTRYPIRPGAIQIRQNPTSAHRCEMIVPTKDVLADTIPVPERQGPRSINDRIEAAVAVDGTVLGWDCHKDVHGMVAGMTDAGKTVFMDAHIFETTRSADCATWLICGAKPVRALLPWLLPFLEGRIGPHGKPCEPVIDWFAPDLYEAGMMLMDAIVACERRQASAALNGQDRWYASPEAPALVIFVDESPKFLQSNYRFETPKGEKKTFSELLLDLETVSRSEDIHLFYLTQRGTVSMNGADAGDIKSQTSYRAGFHATGIIDANAVFNTSTHGVNVESLPKGGLYLEMQGYSQPILAKGMYADHDRKKRAAVEHSIYCGPLDSWTVDPDPDSGYEGLYFYHERWTRPGQQAFLRQLCANPVRTVPGEAVLVADEPARSASPVPSPTGPVADEQGEIDKLDALFEAPAYEPPPAWQINPELAADTRALLTALAGSDLLYTTEKYVRARDLLALAVDELDWEESSTAGGRRVAAALRQVDVVKVEPRPLIDQKKTIAYLADDLRAAVDKHRMDGEQP